MGKVVGSCLENRDAKSPNKKCPSVRQVNNLSKLPISENCFSFSKKRLSSKTIVINNREMSLSARYNLRMLLIARMLDDKLFF